jgi:transaldolase/glucose-6-phosphate isomerase
MLVESHLPPVARSAVANTWRRWHQRDLFRRLWNGDSRLFSEFDLPELADRLGWLTLHNEMPARLQEFEALADQVGEIADDVVLLGMGGSSLAPEVFAEVFGSAPGRPRLAVLDSTHPASVLAAAARIDPKRAVFVVSSKSGGTLETMSFFRYFWDLTGGDGSRFIAITDPGSSLQRLGEERGFRAVVTAPANVGGRYSALSPFGLVPAALIGVDIGGLLAGAAEFAAMARHPAVAAADLGAVWGTLAMLGRDKLTIHTSERLNSFPAWMEQLIAESLGKTGTGVVPVAGEDVRSDYGDDRAFLTYRLRGEPAVIPWEDLVASGHPVTRVELDEPLSLGAEMLRAEIATAAAGEILGVQPFDQPDVEAAKVLAKRAMEEPGEPIAAHPFETVRPQLEQFLASTQPGDYIGIQAYLHGHGAELAGLRTAIGARTGLPTTLGIGPRFLHSTGQLHKGGPDSGVFVQLVDHPSEGVGVPETGHDFASIISAQAAGDYQALIEAGKRVIRIDLGSDPAPGLVSLASLL